MVNSRNKGAAGEREFARELERVLPGVEARRGVQHAGGPESPDVVHSLTGIHFEVKRTERLQLRKAIAQAEEDCGNRVPVVAHRWNNGRWYVILPFEDLPAVATNVYLTVAENA